MANIFIWQWCLIQIIRKMRWLFLRISYIGTVLPQRSLRLMMINDRGVMKFLRCHYRKNWDTIIVKLIHKCVKWHRWAQIFSMVMCWFLRWKLLRQTKLIKARFMIRSRKVSIHLSQIWMSTAWKMKITTNVWESLLVVCHLWVIRLHRRIVRNRQLVRLYQVIWCHAQKRVWL